MKIQWRVAKAATSELFSRKENVCYFRETLQLDWDSSARQHGSLNRLGEEYSGSPADQHLP
jgi:hypothetical protein